jgi:hypothetical protein
MSAPPNEAIAVRRLRSGILKRKKAGRINGAETITRAPLKVAPTARQALRKRRINNATRIHLSSGSSFKDPQRTETQAVATQGP